MRKITPNKKNRKEKGIRLESIGSKPHSKVLSFLRERSLLNLTDEATKYKTTQRRTHTNKCTIICINCELSGKSIPT